MKACPIHLHRNGPYWRARWLSSDGREMSRALGRCSKREAQRRCWELAAEFATEPGKRDAAGAPTLGEWHEQYPELRPDLSGGTLALHDRTLRYLIERFGAGRRLDKISPREADDWRLWLGKQPGPNGKLGPHTVAGHIRNAKVIFGVARRRRLIGANPFDDLVGQAPRVAKDWRQVTHDDLERIMRVCPNDAWRCLFALCRLAGLRLGEAERLRWGDVDLEARRLRVWPEHAETTKQRAREVPVAPRLAAVLLEAFSTAGEDSVGPCDGIRRSNVHRDAGVILRRSGVGRYKSPFHTLRKCCENEWKVIAPWPTVCAWLGHSAKVAAEHYLRPGEDEFERVSRRARSTPDSDQSATKIVRSE